MSVDSRFKKLFEPTAIGGMEIKNRIVMSPMLTSLQPKGHYGIDLHKDYYEARAKGGAGLIILEITSVDYDIGRTRDEQLRLDDDRFIPGMSEIAEAIKRHGARAAVQLHHGGFAAKSSVTGVQPIGPSAVASPGCDTPRELTTAEITDIVARFAKAAERVKKAGFDGVEFAAGHYYLIAEFLSSVWNKRRDDYGGSLRNRARLLLEIIKATRDLVGPSYPLWCRFNGVAYGKEGGIMFEGMQELSVILQEVGVDAIHIHASNFPVSVPFKDVFELSSYGPHSYATVAESVKKVVRVPVIVAGKMTAKLGEKILREKKADLITIGRPLIADPELPNKVMSGRLDDVVPCLYCQCCSSSLPTDCAVNAAKGREREYVIEPAKQCKNVVVIGGGPAGLEAARIAALRGHQVTLFEKRHNIGGQLVLAGLLRSEYNSLASYLANQIKRLGVTVNTGKQISPAVIDSLRPDVVIVATGAKPVVPEILGIDGVNVFSVTDVPDKTNYHGDWNIWMKRARWRRVLWSLGMSLLKRPRGASVTRWLSRFVAPFGRDVVIVGGGLPGLEAADFMLRKGMRVTIVETRDSVTDTSNPMQVRMQYLFHDLAGKGVDMLTGVNYVEITDKGLVIRDTDEKRNLIKADTIVLTLGYEADTELADRLKNKIADVYLVGDCVEPYGIRESIASGSRVGRMV